MKKILPIIAVISGVSLATLAIMPYFSSSLGQSSLIQFSKNTLSDNDFPQEESSTSINSTGDSVVAWEAQTANNSYQISFKKIHLNGSIYEDSQFCQPENPFTTEISNFSNHRKPSTAIDDAGNFLISWEATSNEDQTEILLQRFNQQCEKLGGTINVNTKKNNHSNPQVAINPTNGDFVVAWESSENDSDIYIRRAQQDGSFLDSDDVRINSITAGVQKNPRIAVNQSNEFIITWEGNGKEDDSGIYLQGYNSAGYPTSKGNQLVNSYTSGDQSNPDISAIPQTGDFIISWQGEGNGDEYGIFSKKITRCNSEECLVNSVELKNNTETLGLQFSPRISSDYIGNYILLWQNTINGQSELIVQHYDHNGNRVTDESILTSSNHNEQFFPALSTNYNGDYVISWTADSIINYRTFISPMHKKGPESLINNFKLQTQKEVATASTSDGNRTVTVWSGAGELDQQGIFFSLYDHNGAIFENSQGILANSFTQGAQSNPRVDIFNNGEFVICWEGEGPNDKQGIFYQYFRSNGVPQGPIKPVNTTKKGPQLFCDVAADQNSVGDFIITWDGETALDNQGIGAVFYRSFSPSPETTINEHKEGFQGEARVSISTTGNAVITWSDEDQLGNQKILGQQFKKLEEPAGSNFAISEDSANQELPVIAFNDDDKFIIAWQQRENENQSIHGQYYQFEPAANPTILYPKFPVSISTENLHQHPEVAMDNNGNFIITWQAINANQKNNPSDIFYRVYSTAEKLTPFGLEIRANSTINDQQHSPAISINKANSEFTINWVGASRDDNYGINRQNFTSFFDLNETFFTAVSEQEIISGGRTLSVPEVAYLEPLDVSFEEQQNLIYFQNQAKESSAYFEVKDLLADENPYNISVGATDMILDNEKKSYIPAASFYVRHRHEDLENDDTPHDLVRIETIRGNSEDFILDESTHDFTSLAEPQIIAEGTGKNFGVWRFLPAIKLVIPAMTPPGNHTGGLIFSLN